MGLYPSLDGVAQGYLVMIFMSCDKPVEDEVSDEDNGYVSTVHRTFTFPGEPNSTIFTNTFILTNADFRNLGRLQSEDALSVPIPPLDIIRRECMCTFQRTVHASTLMRSVVATPFHSR